MKKYIFSLALSLFLSALAAGTSNADISCQPIYGGGQSCVTSANIAINKKIQNPANSQFVDNLGTNDTKFTVDQNVAFQLIVTNTGSNTIDRVVVKDVFPQFVSFVAGPGNFDANSKTLTFEVNSLATGESRTFTVTGKVAADSALIQNGGIVCVVNQSSAQIVSTSQMSQDNSQFCIQKGVPMKTKGGLPVLPAPQMKTTPPTGPEMVVLPLLGGSGILGYFLRKKSSK
ncbi:MAG: hypothetical protein WD992_03005 [Candidatus Levyibacteriota bacterium]